MTALDIFKQNPRLYIITFGIATTIVLINQGIDFAEKVINNPLLAIISILVFFVFVELAIRTRLWEKN